MISSIKALIKNSLFYRQHEREGTIPKAYFDEFISNSPVIIDAGAAHGEDTVEMARHWPLGSVYAFEPVPHVLDLLKKNTAKYKNVFIFPVALSDTVGTSEIFISGGNSLFSSSLLKPKEHLNEHPQVSFEQKLLVNTTTLDQWAFENNIHQVDLLWLDLQGAEPSVLKASPKVLKTVQAIYAEVSLKELYEGTPLYPEFKDWLQSQGFEVEREELAWEDAGNVLFVRKR